MMVNTTTTNIILKIPFITLLVSSKQYTDCVFALYRSLMNALMSKPNMHMSNQQNAMIRKLAFRDGFIKPD